ncbi:hypothetical protein [Xanthomonas sp. 3058]|uniref:hypothetical protein n=1 Tax=Xanthomonas sp. 3058 TaxID=3035314 RepID=UPI001616C82B|nr:hypothetical protein [Xanthomonas sp. 3058]MBB5863532.1 hypothetical protein [Xanthomonas sp. 3058]
MLRKDQAEAAAEALLSPARKVQETAQRGKEARLFKRNAQRRAGVFGLIGLVLGAVVGFTFFGNVFPAGFLGLGAGFLVGRIIAISAA